MLRDDFKRRAEEARMQRSRMDERSQPVTHTPPPQMRMEPIQPSRPRVRYKFSMVRLLFILAIAVGLVWGGYKLFTEFSIFNFQFSNSGESVEDLMKEVGKLVELPPGEEPTVATIEDMEPLRGQAFFIDAKVGDKVLIFGTSKKAILYRPSEKKIIAIAPLNN